MTLIHVGLELMRLFPETLICGTLMAVICSIFGIFVLFKRVVFVSIALSEVATLGLAFSLVFHLPPLLGSMGTTAAGVALLAVPEIRNRIPRDVMLAALFLAASSGSMLLVAQHGVGLEAIKAMLYGDLLVCSSADRWTLLATGVPCLVALLLFLRPLMMVFADREAAQVMGLRSGAWELVFFVLLGIVVSGASKNGGALLVFALLVIVPATALLLARRLWAVIVLAAGTGIGVVWVGSLAAYSFDLPVNPSIIICSIVAFVVAIGGTACKKQIESVMDASAEGSAPSRPFPRRVR